MHSAVHSVRLGLQVTLPVFYRGNMWGYLGAIMCCGGRDQFSLHERKGSLQYSTKTLVQYYEKRPSDTWACKVWITDPI